MIQYLHQRYKFPAFQGRLHSQAFPVKTSTNWGIFQKEYNVLVLTKKHKSYSKFLKNKSLDAGQHYYVYISENNPELEQFNFTRIRIRS